MNEKGQAALAEIPGAVAGLRGIFESGRTRPIEWRLKQLDGMSRMIKEREQDLFDALKKDLGRCDIDSYFADLGLTAKELQHTRRRLRKWLKPKRVSAPIFTQPGSCRIYREPLGLALIIGPWNYPFSLLMAPLAGALAGGNCAIIKPSELSEHTSALVAKILPEYVDHEAVRVIQGGVPETTKLLEQQFDHIFYTGNTMVGRIIMTAAAKHLTPVTLELGGKSPAIVDRNVNLEVAARRIVWGKFVNAGQTCVAPDYVLADQEIHDALLEKLAQVVRRFYGEEPKFSPDFARIINKRHHRRIVSLIKDGELVIGGDSDEESRYIAPTILKNVRADSAVMQEEIFGPILPVLKVDNVGDAIRFINERPKPLAAYIFSGDRSVRERVYQETSSGGVVGNHVWLHLGVSELPFGGVGESGMGAYHGRNSFETFTHAKAVLDKSFWPDPSFIYPPYGPKLLGLLRKLL